MRTSGSFFFSSRRRHTRCYRDWSSDVCSSDLPEEAGARAVFLGDAAVERLTDPGEIDLLRRLAAYPRMIEAAAVAHEPHRIAFYLYDLASEFHALWTRGRDLPS